MKMTKKQLAALNRIMEREQVRYDRTKPGDTAGVHPSGERFAVTDGSVILLFVEKPEGVPEAEHTDTFEKFVQDYLTEYDEYLVDAPPTVDDCKEVIRNWEKMDQSGKPLLPRITITAHDDNGEPITSYFNAQLYIDLLESVGPYHDIYMVNSRSVHFPLPCLLVYKRGGLEALHAVNWSEPAMLLPCRP
jgi:hypothetical protein